MRPDILTVEGNYFDFLYPETSPFSIDAVAHALSNICRFGGHTLAFYSVAQHSVLVSRVVPEEHAMAGLLHDASEAFVGDVVTPLKMLLSEYRAIEERVEKVILSKFGIIGIPECVKYADLVALRTEQRDLLPMHATERWGLTAHIAPLRKRIAALAPKEAKVLFLARYREIVGDKKRLEIE